MLGHTVGTKHHPEKERRESNEAMWARENLPPVQIGHNGGPPYDELEERLK